MTRFGFASYGGMIYTGSKEQPTDEAGADRVWFGRLGGLLGRLR